MSERVLYSGYLTFRNETFSFSFDGAELHLIPTEEKEESFKWKWLTDGFNKWAYSSSSEKVINEKYIVGECFETSSRIVFFLTLGRYINQNNAALVLFPFAFILFKYNRESIDCMSFMGAEINHIHPTTKALIHDHDAEIRSFSVKTVSLDKTRTTERKFEAFGKKVKVYFGGSVHVTSNIDRNPLQIDSLIIVKFEPTDDYEFLYNIYNITKSFIQFLSYRKNVKIEQVSLSAPYGEGQHEKCADFFIVDDDNEQESYPIEKDMFIHQEDIDGIEGLILSDIAERKIILRHLPESYRQGRSINESRFVMIVAAFEWEFDRLYPKGIIKSQKRIEAEKGCSEKLQELVEGSTGKAREIYKFLSKEVVCVGSLENKIVQTLNDFPQMNDIFGKELYRLNEETFDIPAIGSRLSKQRNHFAHGDLDEGFIEEALLDLIYLEWIIYAMQLRVYGLSDDNIHRAINSLFKQNKVLK